MQSFCSACLHAFREAFYKNHSRKQERIFTLLIVLLSLPAFSGCLPAASPTPQEPQATALPTATPAPEAQITFRVELPAPLSPGDSLLLTLLDEVTGLALNPSSHIMEAEDPTHFSIDLPFQLNSVVKYRYVRKSGSMMQEHVSDGRAVRYRLLYVDGPGTISDKVSRWTDTDFSGPTGRISGKLINAETGARVPNVLVTAGGAQTLSGSDGGYLLEGLPAGLHNLVTYSLDGAYRPFQQGATVAQGSNTPADIRIQPLPLVKVVFTVSVPENSIPGVPVRLAGNLYQLGNTFADNSGGVSTVAVRMPVLNPLGDGRYSISLDLPAGADVRYKYTLGDGLWNAEHNSKGDFKLRQLIVPSQSTEVIDRVETWSDGKSAPITFDITVPSSTLAEDYVSIQLKPAFAWTETLPMWGIPSQNRWMYVLYSPLNTLGSIGYRYCRNGQCGSADDARTAGLNVVGMSVNTSLLPETIDDPVSQWMWLGNSTGPTTVPNVTINRRNEGFIAGIEFQPYYHPTWHSRYPQALLDIKNLNANWLILSPTWTFTRVNLPVLEPDTQHDALWPELSEQIRLARGQSMDVALFPSPNFSGSPADWWSSGARDFAWWNAWFDRYRTFLLHHADLAEQTGARMLIIGGDWVAPALPGGTLKIGSPSGVPEDAPARWSSLIADIRKHFSGQIAFAFPFSAGFSESPEFLDAVDHLYVLWSEPISSRIGASAEEMSLEAGKLLDEGLLPVIEQIGKPVTIGVGYPSARGAVTGCISDQQGGCAAFDSLSRPNADFQYVELDVEEQAAAYSAVMLAVNDREWIDGVVSRGYYPPAALQDKSLSIHGKPARNAVWYWFPRFLGLPVE